MINIYFFPIIDKTEDECPLVKLIIKRISDQGKIRISH